MIRSPHHSTASRRRLQREGFSLLEVILAMAILFFSLAAIGQLLDLGIRGAQGTREQTQAQLWCEAVMSEIKAGIITPDPVGEMPIEANPEWLYSIEWETADQTDIVVLRVTVRRDLPLEQRPASFTLIQWIRDPNLAATEETDETVVE
ncbi:Hypothetical protein PBC10988_27930 [Planctomycetales bacterium 10988]|nr:Hypothetical protein PBC10988_27930 [Planctomycetales bacterium 10988]